MSREIKEFSNSIDEQFEFIEPFTNFFDYLLELFR